MPPSLTQVIGGTTLFNNKNGVYTFNANAIAQSVSTAVQGGTTNILKPISTSTGTEIYMCTSTGNTYPLDSSSSIQVSQDASSKIISMYLKPSVLSSYINNVVNNTIDTAENIKLTSSGNTLTLDYTNLLGNIYGNFPTLQNYNIFFLVRITLMG